MIVKTAPISLAPNQNLIIHCRWNETMTCWIANLQCKEQKQWFLGLFREERKSKKFPFFPFVLFDNFVALPPFGKFLALQKRCYSFMPGRVGIRCHLPRLGTNCIGQAILKHKLTKIKIWIKIKLWVIQSLNLVKRANAQDKVSEPKFNVLTI